MPTRFYFPATEAAAITPTQDAGWQYVSEFVRRRLAHVKGTSAITIGTQIGPWTSNDFALDRQYISDPMNAGITFTSGSTSMSGQLMTREYATADNVNTIRWGVRVLSEDGSTVRATIRSIAQSTNAEMINNATHRNFSINFSTCSASYTTVAGDRLCIEIGYQDSVGTTPEASAKWGENATDLPVNLTQTTDGAGWIEFSNTITFPAAANPDLDPFGVMGFFGL